MPKSPDYILQIEIKNIEDFSPDAVAQSPRTSRPGDVSAACANVRLSGAAPAEVTALANFVAIEFFALAHSTGLYNRQKKLWEAVARASSVEAVMDRKGLVTKTVMPSFTLTLKDKRGRPITLARYAAASDGTTINYKNDLHELLKIAGQQTNLAGIFYACPAPPPALLVELIQRETNAAGGLSRYESIHPRLGIPLNLVTLAKDPVFHESQEQSLPEVCLKHPDVTRKKREGESPAAYLEP